MIPELPLHQGVALKDKKGLTGRFREHTFDFADVESEMAKCINRRVDQSRHHSNFMPTPIDVAPLASTSDSTRI